MSRGRRFTTSAESDRLLPFRRFCEFLLCFSNTIVIRENDIFSTHMTTETKDALHRSRCVDARMCTKRVRTLTHSTQIASCDSQAKSICHCSSQSLRLGRPSNQKCIMSVSVCGNSILFTHGSCQVKCFMTVLLIHRQCTAAGVLCPQTESRRHQLASSECHSVSPSLQVSPFLYFGHLFMSQVRDVRRVCLDHPLPRPVHPHV